MQAKDEKAVAYVPMVLDLDALRENGILMGITGFTPYRIGNRVCQCMMVKGTEEQRKAVINSYEKEFKAETRAQRCAVVSENGGLKRCPDEMKCDECPFYRFHSKPKQGNITFSALELTDDAGNIEAFDPAASPYYGQGDREMRLLKDLMRIAEEMYPGYGEIIEELRISRSRSEIAKERGIKKSTLNDHIRKIQQAFHEFLEDLDY